MEDMEIGQYIRTECGEIYRYVSMGGYFDKTTKNYEQDGEVYQNIGDITKHSSNVIDIIECGDYVNGYVVGKIEREEVYVEGFGSIQIKDIREILTKEQYESNKYIMPQFRIESEETEWI